MRKFIKNILMINFNSLCFILFIYSLLFSDQASTTEIQSKIDNQNQELNQLRKEIKNIENRINVKKKEVTNIEDILIELNDKISLTEKLIKSLNKEELIISSNIIENNEIINKNKVNLFILRENLSQQVYYLYKYGRSNQIEDIFTKRDLNLAVYRKKYLNAATFHQILASSQIDTVIEKLEWKKKQLNENLIRKKKIRKEKEKENINLSKDKILRKKYLKEIKLDTEKLNSKLTKHKKLLDEVTKMIQNLVADKKKAMQREKELLERRENKDILGENYFASMKGKLDWPVEGEIISKFGPTYNKKSKTWSDNPGIDIRIDQGTAIYPVLDGLITTITYLRGYGNIIIIDHGGNYYSVYGNLEKITVNENDYVDESIKIAVVSQNQDQDSILHFEVWGNFQKLNPEDWLK
ncbi:MAG: peptidoglycan DD-metalloendopeptidase family protein [Candidatus Neomarinimicrobiota bacterium]|jgi:septal ring factor EnvC (AmiA/AmiB activator)|nr:peptidoglycan DD-metalloendopeptidase family protein [Candidatus Neomarinimicrobiota bacterium]|tara:strand:- start:1236 stop:2465 length:1230 start_codon:yes stop_codon:yes gene_type:complete